LKENDMSIAIMRVKRRTIREKISTGKMKLKKN
jgi:hypothetical protein